MADLPLTIVRLRIQPVAELALHFLLRWKRRAILLALLHPLANLFFGHFSSPVEKRKTGK
jgi:hypothetical protein